MYFGESNKPKYEYKRDIKTSLAYTGYKGHNILQIKPGSDSGFTSADEQVIISYKLANKLLYYMYIL